MAPVRGEHGKEERAGDLVDGGGDHVGGAQPGGEGPGAHHHRGDQQREAEQECLVSQGEVEDVRVGGGVEAGVAQHTVDDECVAEQPRHQHQAVHHHQRRHHPAARPQHRARLHQLVRAVVRQQTLGEVGVVEVVLEDDPQLRVLVLHVAGLGYCLLLLLLAAARGFISYNLFLRPKLSSAPPRSPSRLLAHYHIEMDGIAKF